MTTGNLSEQSQPQPLSSSVETQEKLQLRILIAEDEYGPRKTLSR